MFLKSLIIVSVLVITTKVNSIQVENSSIQLKAEEITQLLINTDKIRSTNIKLFSGNLIDLEKFKGQFTRFQACYFGYLSSYKMTFVGEFKEAKEKLLQLTSSCLELDIEIKIHALLANLYAISGEYQKALLVLDYIVSYINKIKDEETKHIAFTVAFVVYDIVYQWELSLKYTELLIREKPSERYMCKAKVYKYIAMLKLEIGEDLSNGITKTFQECNLVGEKLYVQLLNISWLKHKFETSTTQEKLNDLLMELLQSNDDIENTKYKNLIGVKNSLFAKLYEKKGNSELAMNYAKLAIKDSVSIGETEQKIDALQVLINHYQLESDYQNVNKYLIEKNTAEKKFYSDKQAKLMAYQTVKHDSLAKTLQISSLNQKNEVLSLENKLAQESKASQKLISILLTTLLLFFLFLIYRIRKQQKQYKKLSEMDHMTGIYNRKGARDYMNYILPYSQKKNEIIAYGIFDLDKFKKINDKFGHVIGDWVIKKVVKVAQDFDNDRVILARLGGEEFSITIRDSSLSEIKAFSEKCRIAISDVKTLKGTGFGFNISASFGITTTETSGYDYLMLMKHADTALYTSKNNGRNQVSVFEK